ncbi:HNH endonuclease [Clostridium estertheticum]|uniref:HNH endonuclease n=1 Tax=Clostridium estertheticum TaxID=238834 RepID=UPI001C0DA4DA|nr:HNH endonuclease [Clostridium estertheticum]MBU3073873.1 HNH endonuclease [Clostridium estertheticum]MBU3163968.1 HNH endonuclease [Clostridium estertheticum]
MKCAYCNKEKKATREHIIPDGFIRGMNIDEQIRWTETAPCRVISKDFKIKDVCEECNNGFLSLLDNYAINAITKYNGKIDKNTKKIFFKYDYNKLSRWLLKVCYNSARANRLEYDTNSYKNCMPYIKDNIKINNKISIFALFMDLSIDGKTDDYYHFDSNSQYKIDSFRIAPFKLTNVSTHKCSMRTIIVNSFAFLIIVYDEDISEGEINGIEQELTNKFNIKKLKCNEKIKLYKDYSFWKNSLYTNVNFHDSWLTKRDVKNNDDELYIMNISKKEILERNYGQIQELILSKRNNKENVKRYYQKFIISISGYDDDTRELYCTPEFQDYTKEIIENFPELIWYMKLEIGFFAAMLLAYINENNILDIDNRININQDKLTEFVTKCYTGINILLNKFALDNSYNDKITSLFNKTVFSLLDKLKIHL